MTALQNYSTAPAEAGEALGEAIVAPSPVQSIVITFNALRPHVEDLDEDGLKLLAGAAQLINQNRFHGLQDDALEVRDAVRDRLRAGLY